MDEYLKVKSKYPDKIPVILQSKRIKLKKHKYLIPNHMNFSEFVFFLRKNAHIDGKKSIFLMIDTTIPKPSDYIKDYEKNNFIYIHLCVENTFG